MLSTINHIIQHQLVPVFYHDDAQWCTMVLDTCYINHIRVFEFTNRGDNALETFARLHRYQQANTRDMLLGAGTIFSKKDAEDFIAAGAAFIVSPCFVEEVLTVCLHHQIPYLPGCMTVKEIFEASRGGCQMVKVFPGNVVAPTFVKAVKAVLPNIKLMVTGGVTQQNMQGWIAAGADAVGVSALQAVPVGKPELVIKEIRLLQQALG